MLNSRIPHFSIFLSYQRLRQMNTMDQMSNVMSGMANIMGKANGKLKV